MIKPKTRRLRGAAYNTLARAYLSDAPTIIPDGVTEFQRVPGQSEPTERGVRYRVAADAALSDRPKVQHTKAALSDHFIDGVIDWLESRGEGRTQWLYDFGGVRSVGGLRLRLGPRSAAWVYVRD